MVTCEVCVEGFSGAKAAQEGGAHRIELCAGLIEGGTTPSSGTLALALDQLSIPVVVLVRPRGGDFLYQQEELETMLRDITLVRRAGAFGIATGALTKEGEVDVEAMARIREAAGPLSLTFHRAFDMVRDPHGTLETLVELGVDRILTSGGERAVPDALEKLKTLVGLSGRRISIMPGGGIRQDNIRSVVQATGAREVHFTAFHRWESPMSFRNPRPFMGAEALPGEYERVGTDPLRVRQIMEALSTET